MASVCERVLLQLTHPYTFPSAHERILAPYNYYEFGQRYIRCVHGWGAASSAPGSASGGAPAAGAGR